LAGGGGGDGAGGGAATGIDIRSLDVARTFSSLLRRAHCGRRDAQQERKRGDDCRQQLWKVYRKYSRGKEKAAKLCSYTFRLSLCHALSLFVPICADIMLIGKNLN
jgi:hypothetical protein